jgi:hypothetical protein
MEVVGRSRERGCGLLALQVRMGTRETGAYSVLEPEDLDLFWQVCLLHHHRVCLLQHHHVCLLQHRAQSCGQATGLALARLPLPLARLPLALARPAVCAVCSCPPRCLVCASRRRVALEVAARCSRRQL